MCVLDHIKSKRKMKQSTRDLQREDTAANAAAGCITSLSADRWSRKKQAPSINRCNWFLERDLSKATK